MALAYLAQVLVDGFFEFALEITRDAFARGWDAFASVTFVFILNVAVLTVQHANEFRTPGALANLAAVLVFGEAVLAEHLARVFRALQIGARTQVAVVDVFAISMLALQLALECRASLGCALADITAVVPLEKAVFAKHSALVWWTLLAQTIARLAPIAVPLISIDAFLLAIVRRARCSRRCLGDASDVDTDAVDAVVARLALL